MDESRLQKAREIIAEVDLEMARLFEKRMQAVREIAEYKREMGLPILDAARERALIERNLVRVESKDLRELYVCFIRDVMDLSKQYQRRLIEGVRIAYGGVEGSFAHIAARRIFPEGRLVACEGFRSAYEKVERGVCDACVLPLEDGCEGGETGQVIDLVFYGSLFAAGMYSLPRTHCLLGLPGADLSDIRRVIGHPLALSWCAGFIRRHGLEALRADDSAQAARLLRQWEDMTAAAIVGPETAKYYGLRVLARDIGDSDPRPARFAVFVRAEAQGFFAHPAGFLLLFAPVAAAESPDDALNVIGKHGFHVRRLCRRPQKDSPGSSFFLAEVEGDDLSNEGQQMLAELTGRCDFLKVAGRFETEIDLSEAGEG